MDQWYLGGVGAIDVIAEISAISETLTLEGCVTTLKIEDSENQIFLVGVSFKNEYS